MSFTDNVLHFQFEFCLFDRENVNKMGVEQFHKDKTYICHPLNFIVTQQTFTQHTLCSRYSFRGHKQNSRQNGQKFQIAYNGVLCDMNDLFLLCTLCLYRSQQAFPAHPHPLLPSSSLPPADRHV